MKNKKIIVITLLSIIIGLVILNLAKTKDIGVEKTQKRINTTNMLTMMLETEAETGNYEEVVQSEWPQDGYVFNASLSRCENGGTLSWNNESKKVIMKSNISDKCYVYFDRYNTINITNVTASEITNNSITLNVSATAGNNPIETYYYSNNDGLSYETSSNNTYTFSGLEAGMEYNFIVYAIDSAGYKSNEYTLQVTTDAGVNFASYIINNVYTTDGTNGLYYHDGVGTYTNASEEAGDNSYRYSGANPNNYVCFGSDVTTCPNDNLYRIIGLFDDDKDGTYNIKLIKYDYVTSQMLGTDGRDYAGTYSENTGNYKGNMNTSTIAAYGWNYGTTVSSHGSSNWTTSELNKINLNTNYINYLSNINSKWTNMIATTTWHLGGMTGSEYTAKEFYERERKNAVFGSNPTTYTDEIGLMYPSDCGYAASPENWTTELYKYDNSTNTNNNWMYMGLYEWTITPVSVSSNYVFRVNGDGSLKYELARIGGAARPVFYLESSVSMTGGTGTLNDPYKIA